MQRSAAKTFFCLMPRGELPETVSRMVKPHTVIAGKSYQFANILLLISIMAGH
jgi:hypothetical protein